MEEDKLRKVHSKFTKRINAIKKYTDQQIRMNILRKHQIKLFDKFLKKLIREGRIKKEELKEYMPKKRDSEKKLFQKRTGQSDKE